MYESVQEEAVCISCLEQSGLCHRHARHVCPQLKEPSWHRDAHSGMYYETGKHIPVQDKATKRLIARKARKRAKRMVELSLGFGIAA